MILLLISTGDENAALQNIVENAALQNLLIVEV